jgi:hypothetical protein
MTPVETDLGVLLEPGATVELRVPKAGRARVISGYFDDLDAMAKTAARLDGRHPGIYFTANPVKPALLARASNRVVEHAELTTGDHDVARRRWLPIDLDPVRPAGVSATEVEHQAAIAKAREVAAFLSEQRWPTPVLADSGNGAYVLVRVDLPNDEGSRELLHRCLEALAFRFDDQAVHVDGTMFNAARIIRVPGTRNAKGDSTPTRPHRTARLLDVPDPLEVASVEQLRALAAILPAPEPAVQHNGRRSEQAAAFDLEAFIAKHLDVHHHGSWGQGGYRWVLRACPFNSDHAERSAFVARRPGGAIVAGCQHYSCTWAWRDLRERLDPKPERPARGKGKTKTQDAGSALSPSEPAATVPPVPDDPPALASDQRILDRFQVAIRGGGVVGEAATAATTYLTLTSRLLERQASLIVKGHSSSGKSYTVEQTVRFFPPEAVVVMTGMSEHALIYSPDDYAHRTIVLYEAAALREGQEDNQTAYFLRSLLSEGRICYPVTVKDKDGGFTTKTIVKEGPTNLVMTTTKVAVHAENETRMLSVTTDDSREQTARVFAALADETAGGGDLDEWVQLQRWLAAHGERRVTIPYAATLARLVPPVAVRLRRDFGTLLALIRAHAILHQCTRDRDDAGQVVATTDDYEQVRLLVEDVIAAGVGQTVSPTIRSTVEAVEALTTDDGDGALEGKARYPNGVTAQHVAAELNLDKSAARRRLYAAGNAGYVFNAEDQRGKPGRWKLGEPLPGGTRLLPVESALATAATGEPAGQGDGGTTGGTVAGESGGQESAGPPSESPATAIDPEQAFEWRFEDDPVGACVSCGEQCHTRDPDDRPRHPLCPEPDPRSYAR